MDWHRVSDDHRLGLAVVAPERTNRRVRYPVDEQRQTTADPVTLTSDLLTRKQHRVSGTKSRRQVALTFDLFTLQYHCDLSVSQLTYVYRINEVFVMFHSWL